MLQFFLNIQSMLRWSIIAITLMILVKFVIGWLMNAEFTKIDSRLINVFQFVLDIQVTLGVILFISMGLFFGFVIYHFEHAVVLSVAVVLANSIRRWDGAPSRIQYRNVLITVLVVMALMYAGMTHIPHGINFQTGTQFTGFGQ